MRTLEKPGIYLIFLTFFLLSWAGYGQEEDWRDFLNGSSIYESGYIDQPYVVVLPDESWLCLFTTGKLHEGEMGQHVVASRSLDKGETWSEPVEIEPSTGPAASWVMPYLTDFGRVYAFYIFNGDEINTLKGKIIRNDMLGWYCYKYSDDGGQTWSQRFRLPIRKTKVDRENDWQGDVQIMWGIGKPITYDGGMMFAFTKLGKYMLDQGEGWFVWSDNINKEKEVKKVNWELLPEGDEGLRNPEFGSIQEEQNLVPMENGDLYCMYRTSTGYAVDSYSRDGGKSWSLPKIATYANGEKMKNPRACPRIWKCKNGKFLFWYHHHSGDDFPDRNPAWLAGGVEKDGTIHWSQPEILIYGEDLTRETGRFSYPDLIEQDGQYWVTTTNKTEGKVFQIDRKLLEKLWNQGESQSKFENLIPDIDFQEKLTGAQGELKIERSQLVSDPKLMDTGKNSGGITIDMVVDFTSSVPGQVLMNLSDKKGDGIFIESYGYRQVRITLRNGDRESFWTTDPGKLHIIQPHKLTIIIDNGPKIIQAVIDGKLGDGGESRQYGWVRYDQNIGEIRLPESLSINSDLIKDLKIHKRALLVSEAIQIQKK